MKGGSFTFALSFTDPLGTGTLTTNSSNAIDYAAAKADRLVLANEINRVLQNAQNSNGMIIDPTATVQSITGSGTHSDPWIIAFENSAAANATNFSIAAINATGIISQGSLDLREVTKGDTGGPFEAALYLADSSGNNPVHGGRFRLTLTDTDPAAPAPATADFDFDATATEIAKTLLDNFNQANPNNKTIDALEVTGAGVPTNPWTIEVFGRKVAGTAVVANDYRHFTLTVQGVAAIPSGIQGIVGGIDLQTLFVEKIRGGSNSQILVPVQNPFGANPLYPEIEFAEAGNNQGNIAAGGYGDNTLTGSSQADHLLGGPGQDTITGGAGGDYLHGGTGDDSLTGEAGPDHLYGGTGNDTLSGSADDDVLEGGAGFDKLDGGRGSDTYVFSNDWQYDVVVEPLRDLRNKDTLDFSKVTEGVTHIFTGGTLVSGTSDYSLDVPQDSLQSIQPSTGTIVLFNSLGFKNQTTGTSTGNATLGVIADRAVNLNQLKAANQTISLRLLIDFGDDTKQFHLVEVSPAELNGVATVPALAALLQQKLHNLTLSDGVTPLPNRNNLTVTSNNDLLTITVTGLPIAARARRSAHKCWHLKTPRTSVWRTARIKACCSGSRISWPLMRKTRLSLAMTGANSTYLHPRRAMR